MDEESDEGYFRLGRALRAGGSYDEAIEACRKAVEFNPDHAGAYNNLGLLLMHSGFPLEAIESYKRVIEINQNHTTAHSNLGIALSSQGNYEEAISSIRVQLEISPRDPLFRMNLADNLYNQGSYDDALEEYNQALELDPGFCLAQEHKAWFLAQVPDAELQDVAGAVRLAKQSEASHVDYPVHNNVHGLAPHVSTLGQAYYRADQFEECAATLMRALEISQENPHASEYFFLAMAHKKLGDGEEARKYYALGVEWMEENHMTVATEANLTRWREEAQALLGE
jgi:tetratricopeptide (TPR) repeat protein